MTVPITVLRMVPIQRYRHFFANSYLQMFVFHHFLPQKQAFLSPEVPEGQKRDKKYVPRVPGAQTRDKIDFFALYLF